MDINEIRALSDRDLQSALVDAKQELWKIRFDLVTRQEKNYSRLPATRKQIARILTVMTERERAERGRETGETAGEQPATASAPKARRAAAATATATDEQPARRGRPRSRKES